MWWVGGGGPGLMGMEMTCVFGGSVRHNVFWGGLGQSVRTYLVEGQAVVGLGELDHVDFELGPLDVLLLPLRHLYACMNARRTWTCREGRGISRVTLDGSKFV